MRTGGRIRKTRLGKAGQKLEKDSQHQHQQISHSYETTTAHSSTNPVSSGASSGAGGSNSTERGSWANNDEFTRRLIEAVRKQPSLYNPNHEHYGNKHTNSQIRNTIWSQLCDDLGFPDGAQQLQTVWKRIRDRYVRERRKRRLAEQSGNVNSSSTAASTDGGANAAGQNAACRHFDSMRWIDAYIFESNSNKQSGATSSNSNNQMQPTETVYYMQGEQGGNDINYSYRSNHPDFLNVSTASTSLTGNTSLNFSHNGSVLDTSASPCSSTTSSEISVGSTTFTAAASSKGQQPPTSASVVSTTSESYDKQIETKDGAIITVTQRGKIPTSKKDNTPRIVVSDTPNNVNVTSGANVVRMFVDPTQLQVAAPNKVYRLVNASELNMKGALGSSVQAVGTRFTTGRKRAANEPQPILPHPGGGTSAVVQLNGRPSNGHLNEEMIMEDGLNESRQIVMESGSTGENVKFNVVQGNVIDPNNVGQTMVTIGNAGVQLQPHHMNQTIQIASTSHRCSSINNNHRW
ncbi:hypothetical protein L596_017660 [Steinernema carpocapsae]|uniref:MADF domain-containing protein n=1 Tax=Steinernema carpocapsae TaxID=34508 RepID=A0A4U5N2C1_STECR|nr:hypothetical protein L596_017660 [Steinernema carpocapsae]